MMPNYNLQAPKKSTNLTINSDLLRQAKEFDINLSATLEQALAEALKKHQQQRWLTENKTAINAYNQHIEEHGVFGDTLRSF
jgi:antitoxin CcdA